MWILQRIGEMEVWVLEGFFYLDITMNVLEGFIVAHILQEILLNLIIL
jgi:DNA-directed RNA polymerase beta subunit